MTGMVLPMAASGSGERCCGDMGLVPAVEVVRLTTGRRGMLWKLTGEEDHTVDMVDGEPEREGGRFRVAGVAGVKGSAIAATKAVASAAEANLISM